SRNLVGDSFGGMKMSRIEAQQLVLGDRVAQIEFVRANDATFRSNSKQFALHRIEVELRVERLSENLVERTTEKFARRPPINRNVLVAVGNPDVRHARRAELPAKIFAD